MPEQLLQVDPADPIIGANIRMTTCTDSHADAWQFAASIRARGVLEAITCHRDRRPAGRPPWPAAADGRRPGRNPVRDRSGSGRRRPGRDRPDHPTSSARTFTASR